jgi:hypothetical protein
MEGSSKVWGYLPMFHGTSQNSNSTIDRWLNDIWQIVSIRRKKFEDASPFGSLGMTMIGAAA